MANIFLYKDIIIWKCSNGMLLALQEELDEYCRTIICNEDIKKFIVLTDQNTYGLGCIYFDFDLHFKNKEKLNNFLTIFSEVLERTAIKYHWTETLKMHAYDLVKELKQLI